MRLIDADALKDANIKCPYHIYSWTLVKWWNCFLETIDEQPTVAASPWHRVEDKQPCAFQPVWAACKMDGRENWTIETTYNPFLPWPWGWDIPVLESGKAVVYAWMDRTAPEPPKEENQ